ncbi:MAG: response regulator transcription factor [Anaerolineales bacterium]
MSRDIHRSEAEQAQDQPNAPMPSVLVVDDDPLICKGLKFNLEKAGHRVLTATNARAALDHLETEQFDAAILDIGLPGDDGLSLCQKVKARYGLPVIFLTARRRELDEIVGLQVGGDDYITKPFSMDLLLAHLKAVLRRGTSPDQPSEEPLAVGAFYLDPSSHRASLNDQPLDLAPREFDLLRFFMSKPDQVFSTDEIVEAVWGPTFVGQPQVLYVQARGLREKIEDNPSDPKHLMTLRGVGYKFLP